MIVPTLNFDMQKKICWWVCFWIWFWNEYHLLMNVFKEFLVRSSLVRWDYRWKWLWVRICMWKYSVFGYIYNEKWNFKFSEWWYFNNYLIVIDRIICFCVAFHYLQAVYKMKSRKNKLCQLKLKCPMRNVSNTLVYYNFNIFFIIF